MSALDAVLGWYLRRQLAVFPCRNKIPLTGKGGFRHATKEEKQLREWWSRWTDAQIGVPCGSVNHLLVVDIDGPQGQSWYERQQFPETFAVQTSEAHFQYWFSQPEGITTKPTAGVIAPEVDIRGDGSYVIGPFSLHHKTHKLYQPLTFKDWVRAPDALLALASQNGGAAQPPVNGDRIQQGHRHQTMLSLAGSMRARGLGESAILTALKAANQTCQPPLPEEELRKMSGFVGTKPVGFRSQRPTETSAEVQMEIYSGVKREKVIWLWQGRIACGKLNLFVGDPGGGKSLATIDIAARVSMGNVFPDGASCRQGDVLILSAEDDPHDTVAPRLTSAGADLSRIHRIKCVRVILGDGQTGESFFSLERDLQKLEEALGKIPNLALIVIDPISAYMGQRTDTHVDAAVRAVLAPLAELAARGKIAVIGVMHLRKSEASALLRVSGSIGFVAAARIVWGFGSDPDNPDVRIMVAVKNNLAPLGSALAYRISALHGEDAPCIQWLENKITLGPDEVLDSSPRRKTRYGATLNDAQEWLKNVLANGPVPQPRIEVAATRDGFSWITIRRAKDVLGIRSKKAAFGRGWVWELSQGGQTCP